MEGANKRPTRNFDLFWSGFGLHGCPSFDGLQILEVGCGRGERCIEAARHNATFVLGVDTSENVLDKAKSILLLDHPHYREQIHYHCGDIKTLEATDFDIVISEDTLEHVLDVENLLQEIKRRMKRGGRAYFGFGPLFHSPFGDHGWMREVLPFRRWFTWPWGHLYFPQSFIFNRLSAQYKAPINSTISWPFLDLNQLTIEDFLELFQGSGLEIEAINLNPVQSWKGKVFAFVGKLPLAKKYFTWGIWCVLRKVD